MSISSELFRFVLVMRKSLVGMYLYKIIMNAFLAGIAYLGDSFNI